MTVLELLFISYLPLSILIRLLDISRHRIYICTPPQDIKYRFLLAFSNEKNGNISNQIVELHSLPGVS
nr:hypothetical protein [uncultured archaeon]